MKVGIIGAGVLGLCAAYELHKQGADVVIYDPHGPFAGASSRTFAWVNANNKYPASYFRLNEVGITEHENLQKDLNVGRHWFVQTGNILIDSSPESSETYKQRLASATDDGYPVRRITAQELAALEPGIRVPEAASEALFYPSEGYVDIDILRDVLVRELSERGISITPCEVSRISDEAGAPVVHLNDGSRVAHDQVIIAAGAESGRLAEASGYRLPVAPLDVPGPRTHSLLGLTKPTTAILNRIVISNHINVRPRHDGRLLVQVPTLEERTREGYSEDLLSDAASIMEQELAAFFGVDVPIEEVVLSGRSFPEDGKSIVGYLNEGENVYAIVTHSGITLGPLLGKLAARELYGSNQDLLTEFRPSRFRNGVNRSEEENFIGKQ